MRRFVISTLAILTLCAADSAPSKAADLGSPNEHLRMTVSGKRAGTILVYDNQPGMMMRAYWRAPWRNRHYFPMTGQQPLIGRDEVIPGADREMPEPAERFFRMWSTSSVFANEDVPAATLPDNSLNAIPLPANPLAQQNPNVAPPLPPSVVKP